ncbi:MAG TPA: nicotinate-nucleotide adenylyltransferase [Bacillota bacterium]|nr:nicotinate-nucleotide adenylyltransferase [Bacillota bacterium]
MKHVGILGGTFDPPHIGHLIVAEEVRIAMDLAEIWFIPTYKPPHKQQALSGIQDRVIMLEKAIADNRYFKLNRVEANRREKSYTIDTMVHLKAMYPNTKFYFIIGADMVDYLPNWYKINELMEMVTFVGVKRPGYTLKTTFPIVEVDVPEIDVSSTMLRRRLENGWSIKYWVPEKVEKYIKEKRLYE